MSKTVTLDSLVIFRNTQYSNIKADYIISARGVEAITTVRGHIRTKEKYYIAATDVKQVYDHFWNDALSNEDKVPAITHMLYRLKEQYGYDFGYLQPKRNEKNVPLQDSEKGIHDGEVEG
jgi:hypothetical protein